MLPSDSGPVELTVMDLKVPSNGCDSCFLCVLQKYTEFRGSTAILWACMLLKEWEKMMAKRCIKIPLETLRGIYGSNLFYLTGVSLVKELSLPLCLSVSPSLPPSFLFYFLLFFPPLLFLPFPLPLSLSPSLLPLLPSFSFPLSFPLLPIHFILRLLLCIEHLGAVFTKGKANIIRFPSIFAPSTSPLH